MIVTVFKDTDREFTGNYSQITKHFRINYGTFKSRLKRGYSPEEAIDWNGGKRDLSHKTVFKETDREFTGSYKEIAEHFGINYNSFKGRLKYGYFLEEAIDWHKGKCDFSPKTVFKGTDREFTGNDSKIAEHFGIKYQTFERRLQQGYSLEEAIEIPLRYIKEKDLSYKGVNGNLREICKHFNKDYVEVYNKLKHNHTLEWSMETTVEPYKEE